MTSQAINDAVNHPKHYTEHPSGVECIQVTEYFTFNVGNAIKYLWRAAVRGRQLEDLQKARWYVEREIVRIYGPEESLAWHPPGPRRKR